MHIEKNIPIDRGKQNSLSADSNYLEVINGLLDEIRESGERIFLDNTDFTSIDLKNLDMTNASVKSAKFSNMKMSNVIWNSVDFDSAQFISVKIIDCHFVDSLFTKMIFVKCMFAGGILNNITVIESRFYNTNLDHILVPQLKSDDIILRKKIAQSEIRDITTLKIGPVISDHFYGEFYDKHKKKELGYLKDPFVHVLNFKHTNDGFQASSVLILRNALDIRKTIPLLPLHITALISQYAGENHSWAAQPLQTKFRTVLDNEKNQVIKCAIKKILVSRDCDPKIKAKIFKNMMDFKLQLEKIVTVSSNLSQKEKLKENSYIQVLNELFNEIREEGKKIILDHVDFTGIDLTTLNLTGASAVSAKFNSLQMKYLVWKDGNFSKSQFDHVNILQCRFKNSIFDKSMHSKTYIKLTELTCAQFFGVEFMRTKFDGVFANRLKTDDSTLHKTVAKQKISIKSLPQTYSNSDFIKKSLTGRLLLQYAKEECTDTVNFLNFEYSNQKNLHKNHIAS